MNKLTAKRLRISIDGGDRITSIEVWEFDNGAIWQERDKGGDDPAIGGDVFYISRNEISIPEGSRLVAIEELATIDIDKADLRESILDSIRCQGEDAVAENVLELILDG